jgi:hypothetical protein
VEISGWKGFAVQKSGFIYLKIAAILPVKTKQPYHKQKLSLVENLRKTVDKKQKV